MEGPIPLLDAGRHRLHHHDGVIHHQAGGQDDAEQGEFVDREPKGLHKHHGPQQSDRQRQGGHGRGLPVLQEQEDDQQHQHHCITQGIEGSRDRGVDEIGLIEHLLEHHPWRQGAAELGEHLIHRIGGADGVAAGQLDHAEADARIAGAGIDRGLIEVLESIFGSAHITDSNQTAIGALADDHILEFLNGLEVAVHQEREGGAVVRG